MPLPPDAILAHLRTHYGSYWSKHRISARRFSELLGSKLRDDEFTRTFRGNAPAHVRERLADPSVLTGLSDALGLQGLFECETLDEVDKLLLRFATGQPATDGGDNGVIEISGAEVDLALFDLCKAESAAIERLATSIRWETPGMEEGYSKNHSVLLWSGDVAMGRSFIAYALAVGLVKERAISRAFVVRPFPRPADLSFPPLDKATREEAFDRALAEVALRLNCKVSSRITANLLGALLRTKSVLFVLTPETLSKRDSIHNRMAQLITEAANRCRTEGPCPIVLIGETNLVSKDDKYVKESPGPSDPLQIRVTDRYPFFQQQFKRFNAIRGHRVFDDVGARLKRGRWYYNEWVKDSEIYPANIRLRAFFASNQKMLSYSDPTAGWSRLAGMEMGELPEDIRLHLEDILYQLSNLPKGKRQTQLRAARWCSTALYWLTEEAAIELGKARPHTGIKTFRAAVRGIPRIVRQLDHSVISDEIRPSSEPESIPIYRSGIAIKAVIQQDWQRRAALERATAHHRVAKRLYESQDNKGLLNIEFPVEPHWGRSRFHFLAECLRHLIRSCEHVDKRGVEMGLAFPDAFPKPPTADSKGCNPVEVVNFCFGELFWRQLNGNGRKGNVFNRKLALRHGAYQLTLELLQLMSDGNRLGEPHWALHPDHIPRYHREVAYAQLDIGDLPSAKQNFLRLIEIGRKRDQPLDLVIYQLDLVLALTTQDDLEGARKALKNAEIMFQSHDKALMKLEEGLRSAEDKTENQKLLERNIAVDRARMKKLERRFAARRGHILYLRGRFPDALELYGNLPESAIVREVAHIKIATLGQLGTDAQLDEAMQLCINNVFQCVSKGLHHDALGFRIALGHLFRRMKHLNAAEATLNQVYKDILQYGCSERTYLAFVLEAGRTVLDQGRYIRAYGGYLRHCADRAGSRGYARYGRTAHKKAIAALNHISQEREAFAGTEAEWKMQVRLELQSRGELGATINHGFDPLFSFDLTSMEDWVERLGSSAALQREVETLTRCGTSSLEERAG